MTVTSRRTDLVAATARLCLTLAAAVGAGAPLAAGLATEVVGPWAATRSTARRKRSCTPSSVEARRLVFQR